MTSRQEEGFGERINLGENFQHTAQEMESSQKTGKCVMSPTDRGNSTGKFLVEFENMCLKSRRQTGGEPERAGGSLQGS